MATKGEKGAGHTPGPWDVYAMPINGGQEAKSELAFQVDNTSPIGPTLYMINAGGKCPAVTGCGPTSEANARLIAAAPELLAALEAFIARFDPAALVESDLSDSGYAEAARLAYAAIAKATGTPC